MNKEIYEKNKKNYFPVWKQNDQLVEDLTDLCLEDHVDCGSE